MSGPFRIARMLVVAAWVALMVALARVPGAEPVAREPLATAAAAMPAASEGSEWSGLYMHGAKIGYAQSRISPTQDGFRLEETSAMRLTMLGEEQAVRAMTTADAGRDWAVRTFAVTIESDLGPLAVRGEVVGEVLHLHMTTAGETTEQTLSLREPIYVPGAARARLRSLGLRPGLRLEVPVFDPSTMQSAATTLTVGERETIRIGSRDVVAWRVTEAMRGIESVVWLDEGGHMLREHGPMGLEVRRESAADAVSAGWKGAPVDLLGAVAVQVRGSISAPRELARLEVRLNGLGAVAPPRDARQRLAGDILSVRRESLPSETYLLPYRGEAWAGELVATPFLQIEHPSVQAAAREALADARDAGAATERLRHWVRTHLRQRPAATIPNAVQVLQTRTGDCNEHAVLFAALARAVGLPARVVSGVVYLDGAFLYHAWNEVWLGEGWVSVDTAFDQMPADATHIKLVEGGPEAHAELMSLVGSLSIEILPDARAG
jgi:hypothetical protein